MERACRSARPPGSSGWSGPRPFSYRSPHGTFTARKERFQRGGEYWKAYRKTSGKLRSAYLGLPDHLTAGRLAAAARALALTADAPVGYPQEYNLIVFARLLIAQGAWMDAERLLSRMQASAREGARWARLIEILTLRTLALQGQGSVEMALDVLVHALRLARPSGYVRLFLDEGRPLGALLQCLLRAPCLGQDPAERARAGAYVRRLLAAGLPAASPASLARGHDEPVREPLSSQEIAILPLLAEGRSNREIARALIVETSTVKWHLQQIYRKLGVRNRVQAIHEARTHGLFTRDGRPADP